MLTIQKPCLGEIDNLKDIDGLYTIILFAYYQNKHFPDIIRVQILRTKLQYSSVDLSEAGVFMGDAGTWSTENIINLELDQANEAAHNPIENYNIEFREGLTEEYLDQLPERSDDTT